MHLGFQKWPRVFPLSFSFFLLTSFLSFTPFLFPLRCFFPCSLPSCAPLPAVFVTVMSKIQWRIRQTWSLQFSNRIWGEFLDGEAQGSPRLRLEGKLREQGDGQGEARDGKSTWGGGGACGPQTLGSICRHTS